MGRVGEQVHSTMEPQFNKGQGTIIEVVSIHFKRPGCSFYQGLCYIEVC